MQSTPPGKISLPPRLRLPLIGLLVIALLAVTLAVGLRKTVTLTIDGQTHSLTTYSFTVGDLLHDQHIPLSPSDHLSPSVDAWLNNKSAVTLVHAVPVQVLAGDELVSIFSADRNPSALLAASGVTFLPTDILLSNGQVVDPGTPFRAGVQSISLQVIPSITFSLTEDGQPRSITSSAPTLGEALWNAGISLYAADELNPSPDTPLYPGLTAELRRSNPVTIRTLSGSAVIRTSANTVAGALQDAGLSLQGLDYSLPPPASHLPASRVVQVVRVTEEVLIEQSPLPFETLYQPAEDVEIDTQVIVQTGEYGLTARRIRLRFEDGQEVSRQVEDEWAARQPVSRIIGYGTLVTMKTAVVDGVEIQYWRAIDMWATSYHPSEVGNITASGLPLQKGVVAIDRRYVPFYTQLYVPGYGEAIAADVGGGVIGRWIDLGYSDHDYVPWHQWVTVYFLWPPPANIVWIFP